MKVYAEDWIYGEDLVEGAYFLRDGIQPLGGMQPEAKEVAATLGLGFND